MTATRLERDDLGEIALPTEALWGIHTARAVANFPLALRPVHPALIHAYGEVKQACCAVNRELGYLDQPHADALASACRELAAGVLDAHILVDALQGGAGTSTNMNVNEVLANRACQIAGRALGDHAWCDPLAHVNLHQSTNDTYPTALRVAALRLLKGLESAIVAAQEAAQALERRFAGIVKVGRTECQDAVLTTLGRHFGALADVLARDRWRVAKCEERLRVVNLGGTAIGTGCGAPRQFIFRAVDRLRADTGLALARAENLIDATQNQDALVEVSGILKALAVTLLKATTDLRWLSSGPDAGLGELRLPAMQAGSSIMPGKVNPVIPEAVAQAAMQVIANDSCLTMALSHGSLELHPFLPLVADRLLDSLDLLTRACRILATRCLAGIEADASRCAAQVANATASATALVPLVGYHRSAEIAAAARATGTTIRAAALAHGVAEADFDAAVTPEAVTRLGDPTRPQPA